MREIVLDTETTGLKVSEGARIVEIGALELMHHLPTGRQLHFYINPEREVDAAAFDIHGLSTEFLSEKPVFADIVDSFLAFIGDDPLVIHNAPFDMGFINAELARLGRDILPMSRSIDTLMMARKKFPGAQAKLDALCRRFEIDNSHRDLHGALIDADLLAQVYIELLGGRQPGLSLDSPNGKNNDTSAVSKDEVTFTIEAKSARPVRAHAPTADELSAHAAFLQKLKNPIWSQGD